MKIGLVSGEYPPMQGGVGAFTQELARALAAEGHEIHIITSREARPETTDRSLASLAEPVPLPFAQLHPRARRWYWRDINLLADIIERFGLDVVNIQYQAAAYNMRVPAINFAPWRLNGLCRTVATFHDLRVPYLFPKAGRLRDWTVRRLARTAHGVIVTNRADEAALAGQAAHLARIPIGSNIAVCPTDAAAVAGVRAELGLGLDDFLLGYFGFLNESKGADTLLAALAELPAHYHLLFVGGRTGASDPLNNQQFAGQLDGLIERHELRSRVHFTGFLPDEATSQHLAAVDLMVLPYKDGASLRRGTLMAALAHGRPTVTTEPAGPLPELSDSAAVHLVPPANALALGRAIEQLAAQPDQRLQLGRAAAQLAEQFRWDHIARQTATFFATL
ncbi:MAG: glycosyltransferase family 4 protein [Anaerolineales bacterium]|nr:glycosyltransferase family 4 protein [Anaerolineales bacterium]